MVYKEKSTRHEFLRLFCSVPIRKEIIIVYLLLHLLHSPDPPRDISRDGHLKVIYHYLNQRKIATPRTKLQPLHQPDLHLPKHLPLILPNSIPPLLSNLSSNTKPT